MKQTHRAALGAGAVTLWLWATPGWALADHLSGGAPDEVGLYAALALTLAFGGLQGWLGLAPAGWRSIARRAGPWLVALGAAVLTVGGFRAYSRALPEEILGGTAWARQAEREVIGTLLVFAVSSATAMWWGNRSGFLGRGEGVKYRHLERGDALDPLAVQPVRQVDERLALVPVIATALLSLGLVVGVAVVLLRLP
ncbi:MAG: hypothetical protein ACM3ZA_10155, partial [Bacillota bacterium]